MEIPSIRAGYADPVQTIKDGERLPAKKAEEKPDKAAELETRRQTLQNQILLAKNAGDAGEISSETVKTLEKQLEKLSAELKTVKTQEAGGVSGAAAAPRFDEYVEGGGQAPSPGLYEVRGDGEGGYQVYLRPYSEDGEEAAPAEGGGEPRKVTKTTVDTDRVDAELRRLKKERQSLEQQAAKAQNGGDGEKAAELKQKLASLDVELSAKDNDAYRKQHAAVTQG